VVDVYIRRLRVKLGERPGGPTIKTVRGIGYRLATLGG
jgi:DNA-binding response OmpR family regulator